MKTTRIIEQYLDGTLTDQERLAVDIRASQDHEFSKLIILHKEVNESIRDEELSLLQDQIRKVSEEYFISLDTASKQALIRVKHRPFIYHPWLRLAAFFVLVAVAGIILKMVIFTDLSAAKLYQKYYTTYDADVILRSPDYTGQSPLDRAILNYNSGNYTAALRMFNEIREERPADCLVLFYSGLTLMGIGDHESAVSSFKAIPPDSGCPFNEQRDWYLALSLLKLNNGTAAAEIFNQIRAGGGFYARRSEQILKHFNP